MARRLSTSPGPYLVSLPLHILGTALFTWCFHFLFNFEGPAPGSFGGNFQHFTTLGLAAAFLCFTLGILADLTSSPLLFSLKNSVSILATPIALVVSALYWGISAVDPTLVVPADIALPLSSDLAFHAAPAVLLALDLLLLSPPWAVSGRGALSIAGGLAVGYWYWVELCFEKNGWYAYPVFELLSTPQRVLLFAFGAALWTASFSLLKWLHIRLRGSEAHPKAGKTQ